MLVSRSYSSWSCAANKYEKDGPKSLSGRGMRDVLRYLISPKDLDEEVHLKYGIRTDLAYKEKEEMLLKTLGGTLSNQFRNKFSEIYHFATGRRVHYSEDNMDLLAEIDMGIKKDKFTELNNTFNTFNDNNNSKTSKTELLKIATKVSELLESVNEKDKNYVLSLI